MNDRLDTIWQHVLKELKKKVSTANFFTLFANTGLLSLEDNIATIATPSTVVGDLLYKRFYKELKASLDEQTKENNELLFIVQALNKSPIKEKTGPLFATELNGLSEKDRKTTPILKTEIKPSQPSMIGHLPRVRKEYNFATFAVSSTNQLAFVSSQNVAQNPGQSYNPFFIYGPVGVGKTHLLHAIANHIYMQNPEQKTIYLTSEEFTNEVVEAIKNNDTSRMKKRFRTAALLLIDDIQFIEGKDRVQEELFHTFNILIDQGSQIVLSSDRPPQEIKKLEKRLSSRFAGGLTVDIEAPDFELKTAILLKKAEKYGWELSIEVAKLLANGAQDTRSLEGLLLRAITLATSLQQSEITSEVALKALGKETEEKRGSLHADDIIKEVCNFYSIKPTQLKGPKRDASLVRARQITMYMLKAELKLTLVEIGNILGGRDHTTVMHGVEKIEGQLEGNVHISQDISGIKQLLRV